MTPDEVRRLGEFDQIIIIANKLPIHSSRFWFTNDGKSAKTHKLGEALTVHIQSPDKDEYGSDKFNKSNKNSNKNKNNHNYNQQNNLNKQNQSSQSNQPNRPNNGTQVGNNRQSDQTKVTKEYRPDSIEEYENIQF